MAKTATAGPKRRTTPSKAAPRRTAQKSSPAKSAKSARSSRSGTSRSSSRTGRSSAEEHGMRMHTTHPSVPIPYLTAKDMAANARMVGAMLPPLPPPRRLAFYGGLGVMAVAGLVEWPIAVAIGAAAAVARSRNGDGRRS